MKHIFLFLAGRSQCSYCSTIFHCCFHVIIMLKPVTSKMFFLHHKKMVTNRYQIRAVYEIFQYLPPETLQKLLGCHDGVQLHTVLQIQRSPEHFHLIAMCKHFSIAEQVTDCCASFLSCLSAKCLCDPETP